MIVLSPTWLNAPMPKSMIFARVTPLSGTMMLSGDTSRWMMPRSWAARSPEAYPGINLTTSASNVSGPSASIGQRIDVDKLHRQIRPPQHRLDREQKITHDAPCGRLCSAAASRRNSASAALVLGHVGQQHLDQRPRRSAFRARAELRPCHRRRSSRRFVDAVEARSRGTPR